MGKDGGKIDKTFLFLLAGIVLFGLIVLASASGPVAYERFGDSYYFLKHQVLAGLLPGLAAFFITFTVPYTKWKKFAFPAMILSIILLILVFIPGLGTDFGTFANSWVILGPISFQPSEVVKLTFLMYLAAWLATRRDDLKDLKSGLVPFVLILGVISLLMILQPDLGTLSIITAMAFILYFIAGGPMVYLLGLAGVGAGALMLAIKSSPYRAARFMTFLQPELDPQGIGYQINQSLLAIGSGGFFGRGYGHSLQKFQYLPEVVGDSIFAVIGEELGFLFTSLFLAALLIFILRGLSIAEGAKDDFGKYLVVGIMAWFGVQAFVNIGSMIGIMPITGVPLPFLSYGGTSYAISLAAMGLVLNVSRYAAQKN